MTRTTPAKTEDSAPLRSASRVRYQVSLWLASAAALAYLCRNCLVVVEKTIRVELELSEVQMGFILGPAFFWSYALAQIPGGWLCQTWGVRRALPWFALIWTAGTAAWGLARGYTVLLAGRVAVGLAQAGLFPGCTLSISRWHPATERAMASGVLAAAMQVGAALAAALTGTLLVWLPWQWVVALLSLPGLLWAAGFYLAFRDFPQENPAVSAAELAWIQGESGGTKMRPGKPAGAATHKPSDDPPVVAWTRLVTSPSMWLICGQQFFRAAGYVWFGSWFATYLQETRGVSQEKSGWLLAIPLLTTFAASLASGGLSDWIYARSGSRSLARKWLAAVSLLVCAVLVLGSAWIVSATWATAVIGVGVFFAALAGPCAYALTIDMGGRQVATVFSTMNMVGNFGAGLLPLLVPYFRGAVQDSSAALKWSGGESWNAVLLLFVAMYLAAAVCWILLRVEGTIGMESDEAGEADESW